MPDFEPDLSGLTAALVDRDLDGYLIDASAEAADQRYVSGFDAPDPYVTLFTERTTALLVSALEAGRARSESRAGAVRRWDDYGFRDYAADHGRPAARAMAIAEFLAEFDADAVAVPKRFPVATADGLRERGVTVEPDAEDAVESVRATKTDWEVEQIRRTQRANEAALAAAETRLREATVSDGVLHHEGEVLTSERLKADIEVTLVREGCALSETIVACGADAAEPHERGSGPLRADEPIIVDVFPRDTATGYHADMTRTFVVGDPDDAVREFYAATKAAFEAAVDALEPGTTGEAVHAAASGAYEERGYPTLHGDQSAETGFIHGTGHGVGLEVHEAPRLSEGGGELRPGHVVTVEPGLYDPAVGGVRIEDLFVVTEDGHENLTDYPVELRL
jgi:Xaa-Pro aminopeptidase